MTQLSSLSGLASITPDDVARASVYLSFNLSASDVAAAAAAAWQPGLLRAPAASSAIAAAEAARSMTREAFERAMRVADAQEGADEAVALAVERELKKGAGGGGGGRY